MTKLNANEWTNLWKESAAHTTFGRHAERNYDHQVLEFWQRQLTGKIKHVVDLACGNGALVWIANDLLNQKKGMQTHVTGVDIAAIDPFKTLKKKKKRFPMVEFIPDTGMEKLPFDDHSIDFIISQYGLEYSDLDKTVPELGRISTPTARMSFIVHARNSAIVKPTFAVVEECQRILYQERLHELFLQLSEQYSLAGDDTSTAEKLPSAQHLRSRINESVFRVGQKLEAIEGTGLPIGNFINTMQMQFTGTDLGLHETRKHNILEAKATLTEFLGRMEDLQSAALSHAEYDHLVALIEREGFVILERGELKYANMGNIGSILTAQRT